MSAGGSMRAMQSSLKNNRNLLREKKPFQKMANYLNYRHQTSHRQKHLTEEELLQLKAKHKAIRAYNLKVSIIIIAIMGAILALILILMNQ